MQGSTKFKHLLILGTKITRKNSKLTATSRKFISIWFKKINKTWQHWIQMFLNSSKLNLQPLEKRKLTNNKQA